MLFYPILCSFLPYFVPSSPTPPLETSLKTSILPVLVIFVAIFFPLSTLFIYILSNHLICPLLFFPLLLSLSPLLFSVLLTYFPFPSLLSFAPLLLLFGLPSPPLQTKKIKRSKQNLPRSTFIYFYLCALNRLIC